jgi:hypothetical protein
MPSGSSPEVRIKRTNPPRKHDTVSTKSIKTCIFRTAQLARYRGLRHECHHEGWGSNSPVGYDSVGGLFGGPSGCACGAAACGSRRYSAIDFPAGGIHDAAGRASRASAAVQPGSAAKAFIRRAGKTRGQAEGRGCSDGGAIAAIIVQASRNEYYATGHPCACPNDRARNGSACGARSAYSRPGGAAPLCYPSDVTAAMIESYRQRQASR